MHPRAANTVEAKTINNFEHEGLELLRIKVSILILGSIFFTLKLISPVCLLPPKVFHIMVNGTLFQNVLCNSPDFFIYSPSCGASWKYKDDWSSKYLRLVRIEEEVLLLNKPSMISDYINLIWYFIIVFKVLVPLNEEVEIIEKLAFIHLWFLLLLLHLALVILLLPSLSSLDRVVTRAACSWFYISIIHVLQVCPDWRSLLIIKSVRAFQKTT